MTFYAHWRDVPAAAWRWPNYSPAEIACRGTGKLLANDAPPAQDPARRLISRPPAGARRRQAAQPSAAIAAPSISIVAGSGTGVGPPV